MSLHSFRSIYLHSHILINNKTSVITHGTRISIFQGQAGVLTKGMKIFSEQWTNLPTKAITFGLTFHEEVDNHKWYIMVHIIP